MSQAGGWTTAWQSATVVNSSLVEDSTIRLPCFDLHRRQWSLLNRFRTGQGHCNARRNKWGFCDTIPWKEISDGTSTISSFLILLVFSIDWMKIILNFRISMLTVAIWPMMSTNSQYNVHSDVTWRPRYWLFDCLKIFYIFNNNNNYYNEWRCLWCCHRDSVTARVHPVHLTNAAIWPTYIITIYYYSARKLILILPSHGGW